MVEDEPQYGQENVLSWAHGLSIETGKIPFVIYEARQQFGRTIVPAMDSAGVAADTMRSDLCPISPWPRLRSPARRVSHSPSAHVAAAENGTILGKLCDRTA